MPETLESTPAPSSGGISDMIAAKFSPPAPAAPAPPTEPAKSVDAPPAPVVPKAEPTAKPEPAAKKEFADDEIEKERKANPSHKAWKILDSIKTKYSTSETALKAEIARIQAKPVEGVADAAKIKAMEDRISELSEEGKTWRQRVEEADYTRSEDYTNRFVTPYRTEEKRAFDEVKNLSVSFPDGDETKTRQATENDFRKAMALPANEQDDYIHATFGKSAWRVINRINELNRIRESANQAVSDHAANYEKNKVERELAAKREGEEFEGHFNEAFKGLSADPDLGIYVSESSADPEGTALLKAELIKFDSFKTEMAKMAPKDRAAAVALVRARFATNPRLVKDNKAKDAKITSLEADIAKMRGTDPGSKITTVTGAPVAEEPKGIDGMIGKLNWGKD